MSQMFRQQGERRNMRFGVTLLQVELNHFSSKGKLIKVYSFYV